RHYLYRAVDKQGRSVDFTLRPDRGIAAAQAFFRKALASHPDRAPRKVTLDGHAPSHRALRVLRREHPARRRVRVRSSKYLNSIIEQDHRAIKRRCASMKGFKSFANAAVTIAGVELAHRIHKHQFLLGRGRPRNDRSLRTNWERAVAGKNDWPAENLSVACLARRCTGTAKKCIAYSNRRDRTLP